MKQWQPLFVLWCRYIL
uniref:Uncharacterized protein n=1 Tax=Anguilla anguilla TaxID=7936 RepID=A0A0E9UYR6_ANGAN